MGFAGAAPGPHPKLLADAVGVTSLNQKLGRGDLRPLRAPLNRAVVGAGRKTIYRMGRDVTSDTDYWLSWTTDVNVVRGFNADDPSEQTFYSGDGIPKWTDNAMGLGATPPTAWRALGLPAPATPVALVASGGSATDKETRAYVYTYVSDRDQESGPSPAATVTCKVDDSVAITGLAAAPAGSYGINRIRVYRTETGTSGSTTFFFLRELVSTATNTTDDNRALGEVLPSLTWVPAPGVPQGGAVNLTEPALHGLVGLWNGMLAGISGRGIRFCESYVPYAWPMGYEIVPADVTPVALATYGQVLVVLTNGNPSIIAGGTPDAMTESPVEFSEACIAAKSAVGVGDGAVWASPNGLAYVGTRGPRVLTQGLLLAEDWEALNPASIIGAFFERRYFGFYVVGGTKRSFMIDPANPTGLYFSDIGADAVYVDKAQDALFILNGTNVQRWDAGGTLTAKFRSKVWEEPTAPAAYAWGRVIADGFPVTLRLYADGVKVEDRQIDSAEPFRLKSGYHFRTFQIEVETASPVQAVTVAHSVQELTAP